MSETLHHDAAIRAAHAVLTRWMIPDQGQAIIMDTGDAADRARLILEIYGGAFSLTGSAPAELAWLNAPRQSLDRRSVMDLVMEGSTASLARARGFVDHANGR